MAEGRGSEPAPLKALFVTAPIITEGVHAAWKVRGLDIAGARAHWSAVPSPTRAEIGAADVVVVVKWAEPETIETARALGKPIVWDITDLYQTVNRPEIFAEWVAAQDLDRIVRFLADSLPATLVLASGEAMRADFEAAGVRAAVVPTHWRPDMGVREGITETGPLTAIYDGDPAYIDDGFIEMFRRVCRRTGISQMLQTFNAQVGQRADFAISYRVPDPKRWLHLRWKPAIKTVNALASGIPVLVLPEEASLELSGETGVLFFWDEASLLNACLTCRRPGFRRAVLEAAPGFRARHGLDQVCDRYEALFRELV